MWTKQDIFQQLDSMGVIRKGITMVQVSLDAVGDVEGGARGFLDILIDYFTVRDGLMVVPSGTWENVENDVTITLQHMGCETCEGPFSEMAAKHPDGYRTTNPTFSVVIFGDAKLAKNYAWDDKFARTPVPPAGCYGKLYGNGKILLIGVGQEKNNYLHAVEEMLGVPGRISSEPRQVCVLYPDGPVPYYTYVYEKDVAPYYPKYEPAFRYYGGITDGQIGDAKAQYCDPQILHAVMMLVRDRSEGVELCADHEPLRETWYIE